jgi:subtilisin family serine protease
VALKSQAPVNRWLQQNKLSFRGYYISNFIKVENMTPALLPKLAARADVARVIANPSFRAQIPHGIAMPEKSEGRGIEANLTALGAARVWQELNIRGENIVVAGQDTGVQWDHPALKLNYRGYSEAGVDHNYNWHDAVHGPVGGQSGENPCGFNSAAPCDDDQHGSHTMGTVVGDDRGANQIGVAPRAKWMACHNMDRGAGEPTTYIECFEFFLAPYPIGGNPMTQGDPSKAPHVINNSWGCPASEGCSGNEMLPVMQALWNAGIFVVASAGKGGNAPPVAGSGH